ncbi:hypothetical protein HYFRA_00001246 [Hymenoscyphus fraxineus]|uniref:DUF7872 domain-containing protein n=1 Tax=Hymenoscyphus fraxineus TaxID=746836 RepID=A0A9N9KRC7_9HELO|nr:hypothetical protein HYFRA_00001246 [Hymenoscyphus fraxineus]
MRGYNCLAVWALSACTHVFANPIALPAPDPRMGASSCTIEPLIPDTWEKLHMDEWLKNYVVSLGNITHEEINIQAFSESLGAPNFFCGIDRFCFAGQPCIPVKLPAWYALAAIQTWNNYMNSIYTAISYSSTIIMKVLPRVVQDLYNDPRDGVTRIQELAILLNMIVAIIPVTGRRGAINDFSNSGLGGFVRRIISTPAPADEFVTWSDLSIIIATMAQDYERFILQTFQDVINTPIGAPGGVNSILSGGGFLGLSPRITADDFEYDTKLQRNIFEAVTLYSITLALRAQHIFLQVTYSEKSKAKNCHDLNKIGAAGMCVEREGGWTGYVLLQSEDGELTPPKKVAEKLIGDYGLTKERIFLDTVKCYVDNGRKQVPDPFVHTVVVNATTPCIFYMEVREST